MLDLESSSSSSSSSGQEETINSSSVQPLPSLMSLNVPPPPIRRPDVVPGSGSPSQQLHILVISQPQSGPTPVRSGNALQAVRLYPGTIGTISSINEPIDLIFFGGEGANSWDRYQEDYSTRWNACRTLPDMEMAARNAHHHHLKTSPTSPLCIDWYAGSALKEVGGKKLITFPTCSRFSPCIFFVLFHPISLFRQTSKRI